jgi:hypothetical protein
MRKAFRNKPSFNTKAIFIERHRLHDWQVVDSLSEEVTGLQKKIISLIVSVRSRPSSITMILRRTHSDYNQNMIVQALIDLEKRGLVDRVSSKAWIAKGDATRVLEE